MIHPQEAYSIFSPIPSCDGSGEKGSRQRFQESKLRSDVADMGTSAKPRVFSYP